jgi:hypothetical protein
MKKSVIAMFALLSILLVSACSASEFSAKFTEKQGNAVVKGMQYVKNGNVRQVVTVNGIKQLIISRADKNVTWEIYLEDKTYIETPQAKGDLSQMIASRAKRLADIKKTGVEKIQNLDCDKYTYTYKKKDFGIGTQWVSKKLGWPIKTEIKSKMADVSSELTDIKIEKQSDKLFEVPKDFRKIELPGARPKTTK